jgi:hypothetical protein
MQYGAAPMKIVNNLCTRNNPNPDKPEEKNLGSCVKEVLRCLCEEGALPDEAVSNP